MSSLWILDDCIIIPVEFSFDIKIFVFEVSTNDPVLLVFLPNSQLFLLRLIIFHSKVSVMENITEMREHLEDRPFLSSQILSEDLIVFGWSMDVINSSLDDLDCCWILFVIYYFSRVERDSVCSVFVILLYVQIDCAILSLA